MTTSTTSPNDHASPAVVLHEHSSRHGPIRSAPLRLAHPPFSGLSPTERHASRHAKAGRIGRRPTIEPLSSPHHPRPGGHRNDDDAKRGGISLCRHHRVRNGHRLDTDTTENARHAHSVTIAPGHSYTATGPAPGDRRPEQLPAGREIFYVAFTADVRTPPSGRSRLLHGGPGSSSVYVMLGSFAPMRLKTSMPAHPAGPYRMEPNPDSCWTAATWSSSTGRTGTRRRRTEGQQDFWGSTRTPARCASFIKRYLTATTGNSPSSCSANPTDRPQLRAGLPAHEDGVDRTGSPCSVDPDYSQAGNRWAGCPPWRGRLVHQKTRSSRAADLRRSWTVVPFAEATTRGAGRVPGRRPGHLTPSARTPGSPGRAHQLEVS